MQRVFRIVSIYNENVRKIKFLTKQSNGWIFKLLFCHSASLHFMAKVQLKNHRLSQRYVKIPRKAALSGNCRVKFVPDIVGIYEYSWFTYVGVFK
jgi:hypothetical protein